MTITATGRYDYTSGTVGLSTWVALPLFDGKGTALSPAACPTEISLMDVFDSSGSVIEFGVGLTSASVNRMALVAPGGDSEKLSAQFSKGALVFIRAVDVAASSGQVIVNFYHGRK